MHAIQTHTKDKVNDMAKTTTQAVNPLIVKIAKCYSGYGRNIVGFKGFEWITFNAFEMLLYYDTIVAVRSDGKTIAVERTAYSETSSIYEHAFPMLIQGEVEEVPYRDFNSAVSETFNLGKVSLCGKSPQQHKQDMDKIKSIKQSKVAVNN